ncbi:multiprotein-bridging factor 1 family protein [Nocardia sp. CS682]|uniref:helix-turn-helix domain-containing protein n=1 Tax=Nocardia sp. CS682 TaxID=1047172 RepID=UPI0010751E71|nr:helix-turn-helix domain-containing protein [Nocardia sp. CS682]QBS42414.1 XRE family transcriptional regulator [Nocardia sp. CS682]
MTATKVTSAKKPTKKTRGEMAASLTAKRATPEYRAAAAAFRLATEIGNAVRAAREARGWSQSDLAERSGLKQHAVSRLESGDVVPTLKTLLRVSDALDVEIVTVKHVA